MRLDRNRDGESKGRGKYAVVKMRKVDALPDTEAAPIAEAIDILEKAGVLTFGGIGAEDEFFVIMLKDKYAGGALHTYASYAVRDGEVEYGQDVMAMAKRSGEFNPHCKKPD